MDGQISGRPFAALAGFLTLTQQDGAVIVCSQSNVASKKIASFSRSEYSSGIIAHRAHLHFEQQIALVHPI